jgi:hypothetical protein
MFSNCSSCLFFKPIGEGPKDGACKVRRKNYIGLGLDSGSVKLN